jgi:hypothetical protein
MAKALSKRITAASYFSQKNVDLEIIFRDNFIEIIFVIFNNSITVDVDQFLKMPLADRFMEHV